jgi:hypothetical protein
MVNENVLRSESTRSKLRIETGDQTERRLMEKANGKSERTLFKKHKL